jgi:hypothetical protein
MKQTFIKIIFLKVFFYLTLFGASDSKQLCSTLSCIHSSAAIISKINENVDPCEDFYEFSCGEFKEEQNTPDERTTVDTSKGQTSLCNAKNKRIPNFKTMTNI